MIAPAIVIRPDRRVRGSSRPHLAVEARAEQQLDDTVQDVAPDLGRYIVELAFGDASDHPGLDPRTRELVTIAGLATHGPDPSRLRGHIAAGLDAGLSREEIVEAIAQVAVLSAGFPVALNTIGVAREVFAERDGAS